MKRPKLGYGKSLGVSRTGSEGGGSVAAKRGTLDHSMDYADLCRVLPDWAGVGQDGLEIELS